MQLIRAFLQDLRLPLTPIHISRNFPFLFFFFLDYVKRGSQFNQSAVAQLKRQVQTDMSLPNLLQNEQKSRNRRQYSTVFCCYIIKIISFAEWIWNGKLTSLRTSHNNDQLVFLKQLADWLMTLNIVTKHGRTSHVFIPTLADFITFDL